MEDILNFNKGSDLIQATGLYATASDVYGLILGMICSGMKISDKEFRTSLSDALNDGEDLSSDILKWINDQAKRIVYELLEAEGVKLLLPDDETELKFRMMCLIDMINSFNLGFSYKQNRIDKLSNEIKEFIQDLLAISNTDIEHIEEDESFEEAYVTVCSHVEAGVQLCFDELAAKEYPKEKDFLVEDEGQAVELSEERKAAHMMEEKYWLKQSRQKNR